MLPEFSRTDWTPALAGHLLNRAGFGASPPEIREFAALSPGEAVDRLVEFSAIPESIDPPAWATATDAAARPNRRELRALSEEERQKRQQEERQRQQQRLFELRAWWLRRMSATRRPLQEKLALFWHGHFATGFEKVRFAYPLYLQNQTFRRLAAGNFEALVVAVAQDPAMLLYLDNAESKPAQPNENFARELMELFTMGEGTYSEADIKNAARAFCGWTLHPDEFRFVDLPSRKDRGGKNILGQTGNLGGEDAIRIILQQRAAAPFICRKLWSFFAYDDPEPELVERLAAEFTKHRLELKPLLRSMFRSRAFYSRRAVRTQIKSPTQWLITAARTMQADLPPDESAVGMVALLGQELFAPPNVKGWPGGYTWITADTLLKRYNLSGFLVKGGPAMLAGKPAGAIAGSLAGPMRGRVLNSLTAMKPIADPTAAIPEEERADPDRLIRYLEWMLYQAPLNEAERSAVKAHLVRTNGPLSDAQTRDLLHVMMSTPHYQLT